jgi:hypothetical protein
VVYARRPLDLIEVSVAPNLTQCSGQRAETLVSSAVHAPRNMLTITVKNKTVNFIHISLVDFLYTNSSPIRQNPRLARFIIRAARIDNDIANFCKAYLEAGCWDESLIFCN